MSSWDQRIRDHRVWGVMISLGRSIDEAAAIAALEPEMAAGIERARAALAFIGKRLAGADPMIALPSPLEDIAGALSRGEQHLANFSSGQDAAGINSANDQIDAAIAATVHVPFLGTPDEFGALIESAVAFRGDLEERLVRAAESEKETRAKSEELKATLAELAAGVQREKEQISAIVVDYQRQFSEAQDKRAQEFTATAQSGQQEFTRVTTEYQSQFSTGQDSRQKEFSEALKATERAFKDTVALYETRLSEQNTAFTTDRAELLKTSGEKNDTLHREYAEKAVTMLEQIETDKARVEKLVGVIGNLGVTSGYLRAANHARYSMWMWQTITVLAMIALSVMAYRTLHLLGEVSGSFNWGGFAGRVVFLASLGVIAAYAGTQADKLYAAEKRSRRLALELEAIGPYLAPLPVEDQNKFRIQIGERSFGQEELGGAPSDKSPATMLALLSTKEGKQLLEFLVDIAKRATK
jgi:hypothetical protein